MFLSMPETIGSLIAIEAGKRHMLGNGLDELHAALRGAPVFRSSSALIK